MCQNSAEHLGGSPIVVEDPSEPFPALDVASHGGHASLIVDQLVVDSLVIALYVVVLRVLLHGVAQMSLSKRNDLRQTLGLDGTHESLCIGVQIGAPSGKLHGLHPGGPEGLSK